VEVIAKALLASSRLLPLSYHPSAAPLAKFIIVVQRWATPMDRNTTCGNLWQFSGISWFKHHRLDPNFSMIFTFFPRFGHHTWAMGLAIPG
jgi:hypothetical protein